MAEGGFSVVEDQRLLSLPVQPVQQVPAGAFTSAGRRPRQWRPEFLAVRVGCEGVVHRVALAGPGVRLDGYPVADRARVSLRWRLTGRLEPTVVWPADAPPVAVEALAWLMEQDPRLRLPQADG